MERLNAKRGNSISWIDIFLLVILFMLWFLINQVWESLLAVIMLSVSLFMISIYLISKFTGFLGWIKLSVPTWTVSGIISYFIWSIYLNIIPTNSQSSIGDSITQGVLSKFFSQNDIVRLLQIVMFPSTEGLIIIFLFALLLGIALRNIKSTGLGEYKKSSIIPMFTVGGFGSLIHIGVAETLKKAGIMAFDISLWQQFLSFVIFIFFGIIFMAPAIITSHITKNLIIFGNFGWTLGILIMFILIDIASIYANKQSSNKLGQAQNLFQ